LIPLGSDRAAPDPVQIGTIAWKLRYAPDTLTDADRFMAATVISTYKDMCFYPWQGRRIPVDVRRAMKERDRLGVEVDPLSFFGEITTEEADNG